MLSTSPEYTIRIRGGGVELTRNIEYRQECEILIDSWSYNLSNVSS